MWVCVCDGQKSFRIATSTCSNRTNILKSPQCIYSLLLFGNKTFNTSSHISTLKSIDRKDANLGNTNANIHVCKAADDVDESDGMLLKSSKDFNTKKEVKSCEVCCCTPISGFNETRKGKDAQ